VLELPAGAAARMGLRAGETLVIVPNWHLEQAA
jgi:uncharacterized membrane protein (UPF0127 family)